MCARRKAAGATKEEIAEALGVAIALNAGAALHLFAACAGRGGRGLSSASVGRPEDTWRFTDRPARSMEPTLERSPTGLVSRSSRDRERIIARSWSCRPHKSARRTGHAQTASAIASPWSCRLQWPRADDAAAAPPCDCGSGRDARSSRPATADADAADRVARDAWPRHSCADPWTSRPADAARSSPLTTPRERARCRHGGHRSALPPTGSIRRDGSARHASAVAARLLASQANAVAPSIAERPARTTAIMPIVGQTRLGLDGIYVRRSVTAMTTWSACDDPRVRRRAHGCGRSRGVVCRDVQQLLRDAARRCTPARIAHAARIPPIARTAGRQMDTRMAPARPHEPGSALIIHGACAARRRRRLSLTNASRASSSAAFCAFVTFG